MNIRITRFIGLVVAFYKDLGMTQIADDSRRPFI